MKDIALIIFAIVGAVGGVCWGIRVYLNEREMLKMKHDMEKAGKKKE